MKLSFLLLPALLALSSASLQDIVKQSSQHRNVSLLKPDLKHRVPETAVNMLVPTGQSPPSPAKLRQKRQTGIIPSRSNNNDKLKWQTWRGSLPNGAVSIYNKYTERTDYVCTVGCHAGFYNPGKGPYCHNPFKGEERRASLFDILVNEDDFEKLEWIAGSHGSMPQNPIKNCYNEELYIGKNKYGLGKVHPAHKCFYLPYEGYEYWYRYYDVLSVNQFIEREHISDFKYNTDEVDIIHYSPETMRVFLVTNHECTSVLQTATLSKESLVERRWDISFYLKPDVERTITAGIPSIISGNIEISGQMSSQFSEETTYSEETSHSVSVELSVPPNHYCRILMVGQKYKTKIAFTAQLSRTYADGEIKTTRITGLYDGTEIGEVRAVIERCQPVTDPERCPKK